MAEDTTRPGPLPIISIRGCRRVRPANHAIAETIEQGFKALGETNRLRPQIGGDFSG